MHSSSDRRWQLFLDTQYKSTRNRSLNPLAAAVEATPWLHKVKTSEADTRWQLKYQTPLGRNSFELTSPPFLFLLEVDVNYLDYENEPHQLVSKKLRYEALKELLKHLPSNLQPHIGINLDARYGQLLGCKPREDDKKGLVNHLIISVKDDEKMDTKSLGFGEKSIELQTCKKLIPKRERINGHEDRPVVCKIGETKFLSPVNSKEDYERNLYLKSLQLLFDTYSCAGLSTLLTPLTPRSASEISTLAYPHYGVATEVLYTGESLAGTINDGQHIGQSYYTRSHTDIEHTKDRFVLHVEFDLVPIIPAGLSITDVLGRYLKGHALATGLSHDNITQKRIKQLLCGLPVIYARPQENFKKVPVSGADAHANAGKLAVSPPLSKLPLVVPTKGKVGSSQTESRVVGELQYVIKDVRPASQVGPVFLSVDQDGKGEKRYRSIRRISGLAPEETASGLPLANIGRCKDLWVPLESLRTRNDQPLRKAGYLTKVLAKKASDVDSKDLHDASRMLLDAVQKIAGQNGHYKFHSPKPKFFPPVLHPSLLESTPARHEQRSERPLEEGKKHSLKIVHFNPNFNGEISSIKPILDKIAGGINSQKQQIIAFDESIVGAAITSVQDLIRQAAHSKSPLMNTLLEGDCDVLLGIIDDSKISKAKHQEVRSEIKKLGDRKIGAVTLCITQRSLNKFLREDRPYPKILLQKINFMLGEKNIQVVAPSEVDDTNTPDQQHNEDIDMSNIIVVGAHIAQPSFNATEYCPSVASVVGSSDKEAIFYPSSVRLQRKHEEPHGRKHRKHPKVAGSDTKNAEADDTETHAPNAGNNGPVLRNITDLEDMMIERFEHWKKSMMKDQSELPDDKKAPNVLFYRSACDILNPDMYREEVRVIRKAYEHVFQNDHLANSNLTYVIITKNLRVRYEKQGEESRDGGWSFTTQQQAAELQEDAKEDVQQDPDEESEEEDEEDAEGYTEPGPRPPGEPKHQYHVVVDGMQLGRKDLSNMTSGLAARCQLRHAMSIVPPIAYARRLGCRVLDYYRMWSDKDLSNFSGIVRQAPFGCDTATAGEKFKTFVQEYLENDAMYDYNLEKHNTRLIRQDGKKHFPWKPTLDNKMFYL